MKRLRLFVLTLTLLALPAAAETKASANTWKASGESPPATIGDVAWIAGHWRGEAFGGVAEEVWLPPEGGSMVGLFRLSMNGKISVYEILTIREVEGSLALELKHFNRELAGWEEKDDTIVHRLVGVSSGEARFDEMTYRLTSEDTLEVYFIQQGPDGEPIEEVFRGTRAGK